MATYSVVLPEFLQPESPITEIAQGGYLLEEKHPLPSQPLPLALSRAPWHLVGGKPSGHTSLLLLLLLTCAALCPGQRHSVGVSEAFVAPQKHTEEGTVARLLAK